ncbi:MAG: SBBP repeat-containing protein [Bacteroidota bacterium]|nr:SBBP repeat-containing protein [Bacteroidota bacterium]
MSNIFAQQCLWTKSAGGKGYDESKSIAIDSRGNIYITGHFQDTATFGNFTLISKGKNDIFLAKYSPEGKYLWVSSAGGSGVDEGYNITIDSKDNIYITGYFASPTILFDKIKLKNSGKWDIFIAKYSSDGKCIWAKSAGGNNYDYGRSITTDSENNIYLTGIYNSGTAIFGDIKLTNSGESDIFLTKYSSDGKCLWAKSVGGNKCDVGKGIISDSKGNVYLTGFFGSPVIYFDSYKLINSGKENIFIAKYTSDGKCLWAKSAGGNNEDEAYSIARDSHDDIYLTGFFGSSSILFDNFKLFNSGNTNVFIVKYTSEGKCLWAKSAGGESYDNGRGITTDSKGNILITGIFYSNTASFDDIKLSNSCGSNIFISKYSPDGKCLWAKSAGGDDFNYNYGNGIATDTKENIYFTGNFSSFDATFDTIRLNSSGVYDIFVAKYADTTHTKPDDLFLKNDDLFLKVYPNPFITKTTITYSLTEYSYINISLYDLIGKKVELITNGEKEAGLYNIEWDRKSISSGVYLIEMKANNKKTQKKIVLMD